MGTREQGRQGGASGHDRGYKLLFSDPTLLEELVLYNGSRLWRTPLRLESLFVPVPGPLRRHLPRLTYHLLDERRLDLSRPELRENRTAALFRIETAPGAEAVPALSQALDGLLPPGDSALRRSVYIWFTSVVRRRFPDAIIPEGMNPEKEARMLDEALDEYFEMARQEGRQEGQVGSLRKVLLQQMTLRFGRLPKTVRGQVEQITSTQELEKLARKVVTAKSLREMGLG